MKFTEAFIKTAGLPDWAHKATLSTVTKAPLKGHSKRGLKAMLKTRGISWSK